MAFIFVTVFTRGVKYIFYFPCQTTSFLFYTIDHHAMFFKYIQGLFFYESVSPFLYNRTAILALSEEFMMHFQRKRFFYFKITTSFFFKKLLPLHIMKGEMQKKQNGNYFLFIVITSYYNIRHWRALLWPIIPMRNKQKRPEKCHVNMLIIVDAIIV